MKIRLLTIGLVVASFSSAQAQFSFTETWNNTATGHSGNNHGIEFGDFDGDNDLDIATNHGGPQHAYIWENTTGTTYDLKAEVPTPAGDWGSSAFIDLGNDGDLDWVQGHANSSVSSYALINNGANFAGTVTQGITNNGNNRKDRIVVDDYNGDGLEDLVELGTGGVQMFANDGSGAFPTAGGDVSINFGWTYDVVFGNFNNDAHKDAAIAVAGSDFRVYTQSPAGTFTDSGVTINDTLANEATQANFLDFADYDGDGDDDLITSESSVGLSIFTNNGSSFDIGTTIAGDYWDVHWADLDSDGDWDIVAAGRGADSTSAWENDGAGNFSSAWVSGVDSRLIDVGDANNDGDVDIVSLDVTSNTARLFENTAVQVPEPSSFVLGLFGMAGFALASRRRQRIA